MLKHVKERYRLSDDEISECLPAKKNTCQPEGAGGHPGTIISIDGGFCAKKVRRPAHLAETDFYINQAIAHEKINSFFPAFKGFCQKQGSVYLIMENIKSHNGEPFKEPWTLDLKLGTHTMSEKSKLRVHTPRVKIIFWQLIHKIEDSISSSGSEGVRFAGQTPKLESFPLRKKLRYYQEPQYVVSQFISEARFPQTIRCFQEKINELVASVNEESFRKYHLIGSSLLLAYDHSKDQSICQVKLIDFAHSFVINGEDEKNKTLLQSTQKHVEGFKLGVTRIHDLFTSLFFGEKIKTV